MLAERIASGEWPRFLDLPTAAGKTACIDAAVFTLSQQAARPLTERTAPRRIWFVVDRRIVVDEAHERAGRIAEALCNPKEYLFNRQQATPIEKQLSEVELTAAEKILRDVAEPLRALAGTGRPLAVGRLRGGTLQDDGFGRLPSQPAVITSTVDQLGSRLLFRSYGGSQRVAPIHAGLAAHDSLILLDEAHCSVPFMQTLRAVERFRGNRWAREPISTPFHFAALTATPPAGTSDTECFPGDHRMSALDHPVLNDRLTAKKLAVLVPPVRGTRRDDPDPLVARIQAQAVDWVREGGRQRVAVIVNRVRTARRIAEALHATIGTGGDTREADVVLFTGRLRPIERDALVKQWSRFLRASQPHVPERPVVLVSTQTIEVGADFSFDALATECASLDALRQRFGRLNRLGLPGDAPASIFCREGDLKEPDAIYGSALEATWKLLDRLASVEGSGKTARRVANFGFAALQTQLDALDAQKVTPCLAVGSDAPVLLPAHLDLLCQTSPFPHPEPDISLFLHGNEQHDAEVRVLWRGDLAPDETDPWLETVALCPPLSTETVSVPLHHLRRWLAENAADDDSGDVEGATISEGQSKPRNMRPCVAWRGRDRSRIARNTSELSPDDFIVLPAAYGLGELAQTLPDSPEKLGFGQGRADLWEEAMEAMQRGAALRIHPALWEPWANRAPVREMLKAVVAPDCDDLLRDLIEAVALYAPTEGDEPPSLPDWLRRRLNTLPQNVRIERHPASGVILLARGKRPAVKTDLFADDDDLSSTSDEEISLEQHTAAVVRAARKMARHCGLTDEFVTALEFAATWHDSGKLDERFQQFLRHGDEIASVGEAIAKSAIVPLSPQQRRAIREAAGLPDAFRHEGLSVQLAESHTMRLPAQASPLLALHLIASHHGYARPFFPASIDRTPPGIMGQVNGTAIHLSAADRAALPPPHRLDAGVAERFWELSRRYGWWGLAYLEACLRLADWYASEHPESAYASDH